jgi:hypothetical protein
MTIPSISTLEFLHNRAFNGAFLLSLYRILLATKEILLKVFWLYSFITPELLYIVYVCNTCFVFICPTRVLEMEFAVIKYIKLYCNWLNIKVRPFLGIMSSMPPR